MLEQLRIHNIGGIHEAALAFGPGLNVITGESGSGKSSVVKALELLTGARSSSRFIHAGESRALVEATFSDTIIAREILNTGRGKAMLQGTSVRLNECARIFAEHVRIQNQFAQIELLEPERQLAMVDSCFIGKKIFRDFHDAYEQARVSSGELRDMKKRRSDIEKKYSNAREIFDLVKIARPEQGLELRLENSLADINHRHSQLQRAITSLDSLTGGLSEQGLLENVKTCLENLAPFMNDAEYSRGLDAIETLQSMANDVELGDDDITLRDNIETRLGALRRLKRTCNIPDENELLNYCNEVYQQLTWLEGSYHELEALTSRSLNDRRSAQALAMEIRHLRQQAASNLTQRVNLLLDELAMKDMRFNINLTTLPKLRHDGADDVEFTLQDDTRSGRINDIASGGELSRLLLALQLSLPDELLPPTIIFDEVEAGLGGHAAVLTGLQLKKLSRKCQVILVTHEASIAALGDVHIVIQRTGSETLMKDITGESHARVREIARMLSGSPDLDEALEHARILLSTRKIPEER